MNFKQKIFLTFISIFLTGVNPFLSNNSPKEQVLLFSGKIIDFNRNELLAGVSIKITQGAKTIYSDLNGNFFIYLKVNDAKNFKLEFSQVGYITKILTLSDLPSSSSNLEINAYPNPVTSQSEIMLPPTFFDNIVIINSIGETVLKVSGKEIINYKINVENFTNGIYFLIVNSKSYSYSSTFIINK